METTEFVPKEYVLLETEHVNNSPYSLEGNENVILGIPFARNLPYKYNITHKGKACKIRLVIGCDSPFVEEQITKGEASYKDRVPTADELQALRIQNASLVAHLPEVAAYIDLLPHNASSTTPKPRNTRQIIRFKDYNKEIEDAFEKESKLAKAYTLVQSWDLEKSKDILRIRYHAPAGDIKLKKAQLMLFAIIKEEKGGLEFILSHEKDMSKEDAIENLLAKAMEYGIVSLNAHKDKVSLVNRNGKYDPVVKITDDSTPDGKFNRFSEHLRTDQGKELLANIKGLVIEKEKAE